MLPAFASAADQDKFQAAASVPLPAVAPAAAPVAVDPEQVVSQLATEIKTRIIPGIQNGSMSEKQVQDFFMENTYNRKDGINIGIASNDGAFVRAASDSIGGGNCKTEVATALLSLQQVDLEVVKAGNMDAYAEMMYKKGLWPAEWLPEPTKVRLGLKAKDQLT